MSTIVNLYVDQGSDFTANVEVLQDDGTAMNLLGFDTIASIKRSYYSATSYGFISNIANISGGIVKLTLPAANSNIMKPGRYLYDLRISDIASSSNIRIVEGIVTLYPKVS